MFSRLQLEILEDLLNGDCRIQDLQADELVGLKGAVHSALWVSTKPIPRSDDALAKQAIADGRLQICAPPKIGEPAGVTAMRSRLLPEVLKVKTGAELLAALHLRKPVKAEPTAEELLAVPLDEIKNEEAA